MRNDLKRDLHADSRCLIAGAIAIAMMVPTTHYLGGFTWAQALGASGGPVLITLGIKLAIDGWFGPEQPRADDVELVDVQVDGQGRLHGSWRSRQDDDQ